MKKPVKTEAVDVEKTNTADTDWEFIVCSYPINKEVVIEPSE